MTTSATPVDYSSPAAVGSVGTQTWGLLVDAYRELHARRLFWITLVLSMLVPAVFLFVGINPAGVTIFGKEIPGAWNSNIIPPADFYRFLVVAGAIPLWLGFFAAILALISVGGVFPDMISGGSVDLYLSKPISRARLFFTKYAFALLFVAMQVLAFAGVAFIVIGIRGGTWDARIFYAVPLVVLFFSYLYCFCVLVGLLTRSTMAAILLTVLFWGALFAINTADELLLGFRNAADQRVRALGRLVAFNENVIAQANAAPTTQRSNVSQFEFQRDRQRENLVVAEATADQLRWWHRLVLGVKAPLPKTKETVELMERWMLNTDPIFAAEDEARARRAARRKERGVPAPPTRPAESLDAYMHSPETERRSVEELQSRSLAWVLGTSLGFEGVLLALGAWVFSRRDF